MKDFNIDDIDISVVMPVYNAEPYLEQAIRSVLNQTFENFELIILNDGSTDDSAGIILSFKDKRVKYYYHKNIGQTKTSNKGIGLSKGNYIKFFDADDVLHPEHLERQFKALNGITNKLASCQWVYFYEKSEKLIFEKEITNKDYDNPIDWFFDSHTFDQGMLGAWLWLIPKQILEKAGYWNENLTLNNDFDFSVRLLCASKGVVFADGAKIYYRKGVANALSGTNSRGAMESAIKTTELAMQSLLNTENSERIKKILADRFQSWIYVMYPKYTDLIKNAEEHVNRLGGSDLKPRGGMLFKFMNVLFGWKIAYRVQYLAYQYGWHLIINLKMKNKITLAKKKETLVE